jgi:histidinol-phosphate aminotransferase
MDANEFEKKMLAYGIMVRPVAKFGAPGCVRVTIGTEEANDAYIKALDKVLNINK